MLCWFWVLHEFDIVEPDTFNVWRDDSDAGKGKAFFQVNSWLEWMNTVESDDDDEEEEDEEEEDDKRGVANGIK